MENKSQWKYVANNSNKVNDTQLGLNFSQCQCLVSVLIAISRCSWSSVRSPGSESCYYESSNTVVWGIRREALGLCSLISLGTHPTPGKQNISWVCCLPSGSSTQPGLKHCIPDILETVLTAITVISSTTGTPQQNCLFSAPINIPNILGTGRQTKSSRNTLPTANNIQASKICHNIRL